MTTLPDRPNTALLLVDVQNDVVEGAFARSGVVARIHDLVDRARAAAVPVIWVQHQSDDLVEGSTGWQYVPELRALDGEPVVHKRFGDSFEDTTLESELDRLHVGRLIVTGAQSDACVRSTIHGAFTAGLRRRPRRRRPHHRGPHRVRRAAARAGRRPHQPLLAVPDCAPAAKHV